MIENINIVNEADKSDSDKDEQNGDKQSKSAITNTNSLVYVVNKAVKTHGDNFNDQSLAELLYLSNKKQVDNTSASKENNNIDNPLNIPSETKKMIIEQNDRVLGINSTNKMNLKNNTLLNKRPQLDNIRIKSAKSSVNSKPPIAPDKPFSLLPPHYNRVTLNRGINMTSPFNKDTLTTYNNKYSIVSAKSTTSSRPTSNKQTKVNFNINNRESKLKKNCDETDSSDSDSDDSTASSL